MSALITAIESVDEVSVRSGIVFDPRAPARLLQRCGEMENGDRVPQLYSNVNISLTSLISLVPHSPILVPACVVKAKKRPRTAGCVRRQQNVSRPVKSGPELPNQRHSRGLCHNRRRTVTSLVVVRSITVIRFVYRLRYSESQWEGRTQRTREAGRNVG